LTNELITPSKSLGYTDIYLDFLTDANPARNFYRAESVAAVADQLDRISFDRDKLVEILIRQNQQYQASPKTFEMIEKLRDPKAVCVFSGQQAGLLGGPMLTLVKAVAVVKAAEQYSRDLQRPVIPIFWIAGDDHDFEEANHTFVLDRHGALVRLAYQHPPGMELPMSEAKFDDGEELARVKDRLRETLGETDFTPELYDLIDRAYTEADTFVTAFGKLMAGLTRDLGLTLFCPGDVDIKRHAIPLFKTIVEKQDALHRIILDRNQQIEKSGYHIQVEKKDNACHLFCNDGGRKPIMRDGDSFVVCDHRFSREELLRQIEKQPERFSPDVMIRPVLQSYLFPTIAQKGGPAEIAYLAQINPIFELFGVPVPHYKARPTITLMEKRFEKLMRKEEISFEELTGDIEQVVNKVLAKSFPSDLEELFGHLRRHVLCHFEDISRGSLEFDPSLKKFAEQTSGKIDFMLKAFEGKVFSSHKKKQQETRDRIYRLWQAIYPNHGMQERTLNISYFISKYGFEVVSLIRDKMDSEENAHQVIFLSEQS